MIGKENHITNLLRTEEYFKNYTNEKLLYDIMFENPTIFDVGAGKGDSLKCFSKIWDEFNIHCFEPQVTLRPYLRKEAEELSSEKVKIKTNLTAVGKNNLDSKGFYCHTELSDGISGFIRLNIDSQDSINIKESKSSGGFDQDIKGLNNKTFVSRRFMDS